MRRLRLFAALCLPLGFGLGLSGCALNRPPAQVEAPTPAQWHAPLPHGGSLASLADWWRQLDDPLLVELIAAAEAASPNVASAAARVAEARFTRVQTGAALLPSLDGTASASRGTAGIASGAPSGGSASSSSSSSLGATTPITTLQVGLQSKWEVDLFGRLRADRDAAQAKLGSADAKWHDARVSVAAETANAYFAERACQQQLRVAESDTRSRAETSRLNDLSMRAGFTAPADAALARASAADASGRLTQQRAQCAVQRKALVALSGIDESTLEQKLAASPAQRALPAVGSIASVPAEAISQRPDVYSAELGVASASADVGSAEAERYPKLTISGSIGRTQYRVSGLQQSLENWTIGPVSLSVPLLDGGSRKANADAAKARYAEAVSIYRANVRQAVREVEEALVNLDATDGRANDADTAVKNYQASFDATQARYSSGLASLFELEDSRRTLFAAQTARVSLQRERTEAWVALYRSMGGGWSRPGQPSESSESSSMNTTPAAKVATSP
ncbi:MULTISPECIES: efflux transporter outer membrane subunit [Variovorax]|jgi:outer membrane protein, multidrug efflux system|uniref:efflux transporter outer membrane subunit n=1 Tax=Variovorax TaxID=34072 RepID=UPI000869FE02|nr:MULTISPECIES: efflux transporter outer membrane subunit [Variovorax]MBN8752318.1 efflux transporter outer membrane subunit [Variovorax sp.]ODU18203.1 MAG: RND transporter [Variovorax sp. SCN 67-85]ODV26802.1 MAG: RND transporter [Variovorax sp. SCN 67-20]OJZ08892.1 MAG: RND transporter [Variovorax sp. 67-131]UKI11355.1 efflux transporter outer membrane subunit [Variovorax paradoxus]